MVRLNRIKSGFTHNNSYYYIDVEANPYRVVVTTRYEDSNRGGSQAILEREQALELAKHLLEGALTISPPKADSLPTF